MKILIIQTNPLTNGEVQKYIIERVKNDNTFRGLNNGTHKEKVSEKSMNIDNIM